MSENKEPKFSVGAAVQDHDKLVDFFNEDGYIAFGIEGDRMGWSPAETAINAMRELMKLRKKGVVA